MPGATNNYAQSEFAIVGGGVVGHSIAYGLLKKGKTVTLFDEGDVAFRASRGNFGLVWVQGKGAGMPTYAKWTRASAHRWQDFASELYESSDIDLSIQQRGGYSIFLDEKSFEERIRTYDKLKSALGGDYPYEVLGHNAIKKEEPHIGPDVVGAMSRVTRIEPRASGFAIHSNTSEVFQCEKVVLACGLGTAELGRPLGFKVPIRPQRGQVLITEKMPPLIHRPSDEIRQVNEGAIQIGASAEEVGMDDSETINTTAALAANAIKQYPILGKAQLVRSWGALRIMSPDGFPVYQQSEQHPGAYFATCHSGITLAAAHAKLLPDWLCGETKTLDQLDINFSEFSEDRFDA